MQLLLIILINYIRWKTEIEKIIYYFWKKKWIKLKYITIFKIGKIKGNYENWTNDKGKNLLDNIK